MVNVGPYHSTVMPCHLPFPSTVYPLACLGSRTTAFSPMPSKAQLPTLGALPFIVTFVTLLQLLNADIPMLVTLPGIVTLVKPLSANAYAPMLVTLFGIVTLVRPLNSNAYPPMLVTLSGIVTLVKLMQW